MRIHLEWIWDVFHFFVCVHVCEAQKVWALLACPQQFKIIQSGNFTRDGNNS